MEKSPCSGIDKNSTVKKMIFLPKLIYRANAGELSAPYGNKQTKPQDSKNKTES